MQFRYPVGIFLITLLMVTSSVVSVQSGEELFDIGTLYFENSSYQEAIDTWTKAMELDPTLDANAYYNIGLAYAGMKDYAQAEQAWKKTVELVPQSGIAHNNRGTALALLGRNEEAKQEYTIAVQLEPENSKFKADLAIFIQNLDEQTKSPISPLITVMAIICLVFGTGFIRKRK